MLSTGRIVFLEHGAAVGIELVGDLLLLFLSVLGILSLRGFRCPFLRNVRFKCQKFAQTVKVTHGHLGTAGQPEIC